MIALTPRPMAWARQTTGPSARRTGWSLPTHRSAPLNEVDSHGWRAKVKRSGSRPVPQAGSRDPADPRQKPRGANRIGSTTPGGAVIRAKENPVIYTICWHIFNYINRRLPNPPAEKTHKLVLTRGHSSAINRAVKFGISRARLSLAAGYPQGLVAFGSFVRADGPFSFLGVPDGSPVRCDTG